MTKARALTATAVALLCAGLVAAVAVMGDGGSDAADAPAEVLGVQETRPSTTEAPPPTTTTTVAPTTTTAPPPTTTTTAAPTPMVASTGEGAAFFSYRKNGNDVAGSSTVISNQPGVHLTVSGSANKNGVATITSSAENATAGTVQFADGLVVTVKIKRNGVDWRTVTAENRAVTSLAPGQSVTVSTSVPLGQYGDYELSAEMPYLVP